MVKRISGCPAGPIRRVWLRLGRGAVARAALAKPDRDASAWDRLA